MSFTEEMKDKILRGKWIGREEALRLAEEPLEELRQAADEIRRKVCGSGFDLCTIVNAKCGSVPKTAGTVPRAPITGRPVRRVIRCFPHRSCWRMQGAMRSRVFCGIRS